MTKTILLILAKILLFGWSCLYLMAAGWGLAYVAGKMSGLLRPELWLNFTYGFGCVFAVYCVLASFGLFSRKVLLISGVVMHLLALLCIYWINVNYYPEQLNGDLASIGIFFSLWILHFAARLVHSKNADNVNVALR